MRRELLAHIDNGGGSELSGVVAEAIGRHRSLLA
jgi:hypothetical protein